MSGRYTNTHIHIYINIQYTQTHTSRCLRRGYIGSFQGGLRCEPLRGLEVGLIVIGLKVSD